MNTLLWPRLLPGFFDDAADARFLWDRLGAGRAASTAAAEAGPGSGYGGYEAKPELDRNWFIHSVRGPRTAATLGLPPALALGDPAVLLPLALPLPTTGGADGRLHAAFREYGARHLDPERPLWPA